MARERTFSPQGHPWPPLCGGRGARRPRLCYCRDYDSSAGLGWVACSLSVFSPRSSHSGAKACLLARWRRGRRQVCGGRRLPSGWILSPRSETGCPFAAWVASLDGRKINPGAGRRQRKLERALWLCSGAPTSFVKLAWWVSSYRPIFLKGVEVAGTTRETSMLLLSSS